jgi:hypothetical protein
MKWKPITISVEKDNYSENNPRDKNYYLVVYLSTMPDYPFTLCEGQKWTLEEAHKRRVEFEESIESYVDQRIAEKVVTLLKSVNNEEE